MAENHPAFSADIDQPKISQQLGSEAAKSDWSSLEHARSSPSAHGPSGTSRRQGRWLSAPLEGAGKVLDDQPAALPQRRYQPDHDITTLRQISAQAGHGSDRSGRRNLISGDVVMDNLKLAQLGGRDEPGSMSVARTLPAARLARPATWQYCRHRRRTPSTPSLSHANAGQVRMVEGSKVAPIQKSAPRFRPSQRRRRRNDFRQAPPDTYSPSSVRYVIVAPGRPDWKAAGLDAPAGGRLDRTGRSSRGVSGHGAHSEPWMALQRP